jgi:adenine-specific DNA-methyltransferase
VDGEGRKTSTNSESSGRFHTDWLNMMYPRLRLSRSLLREDGVIFVSIADHEVHNLRAVMNEIFGEENFIAAVIWQKVYSPKNSARHFSEDHDYVLVYARNGETWTPNLLPRTEEMEARYINPDDDPRGSWKPGDLSARNYYGEGTYPVTCPSGRKIDGPPSGRYWVISKGKFDELNGDGRIWWGIEGNNVPAIKRFLSEVQQGRVPQTLWTYEEVGHTQEAKKELISIVNFPNSDAVFETPKPTRLIHRMLQLATKSDDSSLVLDFFAGSGSTLHGVMSLNAVDGGNRQCILVQLPEPLPNSGDGSLTTITEITKERLRHAGKKIREELTTDHTESTENVQPDLFSSVSSVPSAVENSSSPSAVASGPDLGFRVFKLDSTNIRAWDPNRENLSQTLLNSVEHVKADRTEQDILFELFLKLGLELTVLIEQKTIAGKTVHSVGVGTLFVCLAPEITHKEIEPLAHGIADWRKELAPVGESQVVFRDSAFADDVAKTNITAILAQRGLEKVRSL